MSDDAGNPPEETGTFAARVAAMRRDETIARTADMTPAADEHFERLLKRLSKMLWSGAMVRGHRRRASLVDVNDLDNAFDDVVNPAERPLWLNITTDVCVLVSGLFTGYAINKYTSDPASTPISAWVVPLSAGVFIGLLAAFLRYKKLG